MITWRQFLSEQEKVILAKIETNVRKRTGVTRCPEVLNRLKRFSVIATTFEWAISEFYPLPSAQLNWFNHFLISLCKVWTFRGLPSAIEWIKVRRTTFLHALSVQEKGGKEAYLARKRLKKDFGPLVNVTALLRNPSLLRATLSALTLLRGEKLKVAEDYSSITTEGETPSWPKTWGGFAKDFWAQLAKAGSNTGISRVRWTGFGLSTKSGPMGRPAFLHALRDMVVIPDKLRDSIHIVGGRKLRRHMELLNDYLEEMHDIFGPVPKGKASKPPLRVGPEGKVSFRKVVGIPEGEGKTRMVAMADYWSQTANTRVASAFSSFLSKIPQDCTYSQDSVAAASSWETEYFMSVDLTKATDRFPIEFVCWFLRRNYPKTWVDGWKDLMVGYPFDVKTGDQVSYRVGFPMGLESCWFVFAVAHHFVMYCCIRELGLSWPTTEYLILGDDAQIGNRALASLYRQRMANLHVEVSPAKTWESSDFREMAKRYFYRGVMEGVDTRNWVEISPFPVSAVIDHRSDIPVLVAIISGEARKGLLPRSGVSGAVGTLASYHGFWKKGVESLRRVNDAQTCCDASALMSGRISVDQFILVVSNGDPLAAAWAEQSTSEEKSLLVQTALADNFNKSLSLSGDTYGDFCRRGMIRVMRDYRLRLAWPRLQEAIPAVAVGAQLERLLLKAESNLEDLVSSPQTDWVVLVRALAHPLQGAPYGGTDFHKKYQTASRLGRSVRRWIVRKSRDPSKVELKRISQMVSLPLYSGRLGGRYSF